MSDPSQQHIRTGLITFADHEGQDHAPDRGTSDPHPGVPIGVARDRGTRTIDAESPDFMRVQNQCLREIDSLLLQ